MFQRNGHDSRLVNADTLAADAIISEAEYRRRLIPILAWHRRSYSTATSLHSVQVGRMLHV
jgi:hypothetical protein